MPQQKLSNAIEYLQDLLPQATRSEKRLRKALYLLLANAKPVSINELAAYLNIDIPQLKQELANQSYVEYDAQENIIAFRGLTLKTTQHQVDIAQANFFTWCAFDALFVADLVNKQTQIKTLCPCCNTDLSLMINPSSVQQQNQSIVMSFVIANPQQYQQELQQSFCCKVHFFCDLECGNQWTSDKPNLQLFYLDDALKIAKSRNQLFLAS